MQAWHVGQQSCSRHFFWLMTVGCTIQQLKRHDLLRVHSIHFPLNTILGNGGADEELGKAVQGSL